MQELEEFRYATALHLSMGYYTIYIDLTSQDMCTIIPPYGKYKYLRLPMEIMCTPDIFQENISNLKDVLEFAYTYLDDLLYLFKCHFNEHLEDVEKNIQTVTKCEPMYKRYKVKFRKDLN